MKGLHRKISVVLLLAMLIGMFSSVGIYATDTGTTNEESPAVAETVDTSGSVVQNVDTSGLTTANETETTQPAESPEPVSSVAPENTPAEGANQSRDAGQPAEGTDQPRDEGQPAEGTDQGQNSEGADQPKDEGQTAEGTDQSKDEGRNTEGADQSKGEVTNETKSESEKPQEDSQEENFYDRLMKLKTCSEIYELLTDDDNYDQAMALTVAQVQALRTYVLTLAEDAYTEILLDTIDQLLIALGVDLDAEYGTETEGGGGSGQGNTSNTTVDHIDIAVDLSATLYVDGQTVTQNYQMTQADVQNVTVTAGSKNYPVSYGGESTDTDGADQIRLKGTFDVGEINSSTKFTVTLKKSILYVGKSYNVEFTGTFGYWDSNNKCPGLNNSQNEWKKGEVISGSGLDFTLSGTQALAGNIQLVKVIEGVSLTTGQTVDVTFDILNSDGTSVATKTVTVTGPSDQISTTIGNLAAGTYTVKETVYDSIDGYVLSSTTYQVGTDGTPTNESANVTVTNGATSLVIVKNKYTEDTTPTTKTLKVTKVWKDAYNNSVMVNLILDDEVADTAELNEANNWTHTFANLDVNKTYTVQEENVSGYSANYAYDSDTGSVVITNTPETIGTNGNVSVTKVWNDNNNQEGARPDGVQVQFYATTKTYGKNPVGNPVTLNEGSNWTYTAEGLWKYYKGEEIIWSVEEVSVPDGYTSVVTGSVTAGFVVTNTHTPATTSISGTKIWDDDNDKDGLRPLEITVYLMNGDTKVASVQVSEKTNWKYTFENVPVYENGQKINYTISEKAVFGYAMQSVAGSYDIKNVRDEGQIKVVPAKITVTKTWEDDNDRDGVRPESIQVQLYANGQPVGDPVELNAENGWKYSFADLPSYKNGVVIVYTLSEKAVDGYTSKVDGYNITNTHEPEKLEDSISGTKTWSDNDNQDGIRPESITVNLLANGKKVASQKVTAENGWKYEFKDLYKYENGKAIVYTVTEEAVTGYTAMVDGYNITNTHETETTVVTVQKKWVDNNDKEGKRPDSITVQLYADGKKVGQAMKLTAKDGWKYEFKDLDKYQNGKLVEYTVKETSEKYYVAKYASKDGVLTITNTFVDIPLTGDTINLVFWAMMVLGAGAVLGGIGIRFRRRKA